MRYFGDRLVQVPEAGDVMGGRDADIQKKCPRSTATLSACRRERDTVRHSANGKSLDQCLTICVAPYAARVVPDRFLIRRASRKVVDIGPLSNDVFTIGRLDNWITGAVPH